MPRDVCCQVKSPEIQARLLGDARHPWRTGNRVEGDAGSVAFAAPSQVDTGEEHLVGLRQLGTRQGGIIVKEGGAIILFSSPN